MKKTSTEDLITRELERYLEEVLSCVDFDDFDDSNLGQYVTGKARDLLKRLPESERAYAISRVISTPDYRCIKGSPYPQKDYELFLAPTALEIDITDVKLESPGDFYIKKMGDCKIAAYYMDYGASIDLDLDKLEEYVRDYLTDQKD